MTGIASKISARLLCFIETKSWGEYREKIMIDIQNDIQNINDNIDNSNKKNENLN